jgi:hypothetical protein
MLLKLKGKIEFQPEDKTKKHKNQSSWKRVALIKTEDDLSEYYSWFIKKRFNLTLNKPLRGSHITFINDREKEVPYFEEAGKLFNEKEINFYIDLEPRSNGEHWWLRVYCSEAEAIRVVCGGKPEPYFSLHLTIGFANERNIEHSKYILECCKRFELISNEPRKSFSEHIIYN